MVSTSEQNHARRARVHSARPPPYALRPRRLMVLSNPGTQWMLLSAGIAQEPVSMTSGLVAET